MGDRRRVLTSVVERETTQTTCAEDIPGLKLITEAVDAHFVRVVEERSVSR